MSSSNIVRDIRTAIHTNLLPSVSSRWSEQLRFGLQAYGLQPFQSVASNARSVATNPHTAARKSERLFQNARLADKLGTVFDSLQLVKHGSFVNVDHSDFDVALLFTVTRPTRQQIHSTHPKKQVCQALERLHQAFGLMVWGWGWYV
jgi:hypothetical protein